MVDLEMSQNGSTSAHLCACGCEKSVKPGQRWYEPACKARRYRRWVRGNREADGARLDELEEELEDINLDRLKLSQKHEALERAYSLLWEEHRQCAPRASASRPGQSWAWQCFMDAIDAAYRDLAKQCHPDLHAFNPQKAEKMAAISITYAEIARFIRPPAHGA